MRPRAYEPLILSINQHIQQIFPLILSVCLALPAPLPTTQQSPVGQLITTKPYIYT